MAKYRENHSLAGREFDPEGFDLEATNRALEPYRRRDFSERGNLKVPKYAYHRPNRNDPCLCGSGLKFKKCCFKRVEEETNSLRMAAGKGAQGFPHLVEALGLALGTRSSEVRTSSVTAQEVGQVIEKLYRKVAQESEENCAAYFHFCEKTFTEMLRRYRSLQFLRFSVKEVNELLRNKEVNELLRNEENEKNSFLDAAAQKLFTRSFAEAAADALLYALRCEKLSKEEAEPLIGVLYFILELGDVRTVGEAVLRATLSDAQEFAAGMERFFKAEGIKEKQEILTELAAKVPFVLQEVSHSFLQKIRPYLKQLAEGKIPFPLPPYGYLHAILTLRKLYRIPSAIVRGKEIKKNIAREMMVNLESTMSARTLEKDARCFMDALGDTIAAWVSDPAFSGAHSEFLSALLFIIFIPDSIVSDALLKSLYLCAISQLVGRGTLYLEGLEEKKEIPLAELSPHDLEQYALYLESKGNKEAAACVREAKAALEAEG